MDLQQPGHGWKKSWRRPEDQGVSKHKGETRGRGTRTLSDSLGAHRASGSSGAAELFGSGDPRAAAPDAPSPSGPRAPSALLHPSAHEGTRSGG